MIGRARLFFARARSFERNAARRAVAPAPPPSRSCQFNLAYYDGDGRLVKDYEMIYRRYTRGWFAIDLASTFPFDVISLVAEDSPFLSRLKAVRMVRLLRLIRIFRILRGSRIFSRLESSISSPHSTMTLAKFIALVIVAGHWVACMWGLTARTQAGEADRDDEFGHPRNWADQWFDDHPWAERTLWSEYAIAFEFGFCTITSVGFGDVTLITTAEVVIATASVILGAFLWAYLIGNACAVLSALDADASRENQLMDDLNKFTRARRFPEEFRKRLRAYFIYARSLNKESRFVHILECLSPALQAECAGMSNKEWLSRVWYFREGCSEAFTTELSRLLRDAVHAPREAVDDFGTLYVLRAGLVARHGRIKSAGAVWGEDFVLAARDPECIDASAAMALTYVHVTRLSAEQLEAMLRECDPETAEHIGRAAAWMKHRVKFIRWLATAKRALAQMDGGAYWESAARKGGGDAFVRRMSAPNLAARDTHTADEESQARSTSPTQRRRASSRDAGASLGDADDAASPRRGAAKGDPEVLAKLADVLRKLDAIEPMRAAIERLSEKVDSIERRQGHGQDNEVDCSQYMFKV